MPATPTWVCTKCGKRISASTKPGATFGGRCPKSNAGTHSWTKA